MALPTHEIETAAAWWALRLDAAHTDKREAFRRALVIELEKAWLADDRGRVLTAVDYDPCPVLLAALHAVGIECSGSFFSADDILPRKTSATVTADCVEVREGRGGQLVRLV